jgi:hypothetical protein
MRMQGKTSPVALESTPAPREGYIWVPGHWENRGTPLMRLGR